MNGHAGDVCDQMLLRLPEIVRARGQQDWSCLVPVVRRSPPDNGLLREDYPVGCACRLRREGSETPRGTFGLHERSSSVHQMTSAAR